jgi:NAD(P)-dependent dehydrogenase (short-subunit alcohol dehydrogenase family)
MEQQPAAIVTGAGRGIGRATAVELARRGYRLMLVARSAEQLAETAQLANNDSAMAIAMAADVRRPEQVEQLVTHAVKAFGRIDAIVHCAGFAPVRTLEQTSLDEWRAAIDTNLSAAFYLARAAWPVMKRQGSGVLVNVSSLASRDPFPGLGAYGAAKAGLNILDLVLAREGAAIGVRVHTIAPGAVETVMLRQLLTKEQFPTEKTMDPAEVAQVIAQCVVGDLRYTSGEVIYLHKRT